MELFPSQLLKGNYFKNEYEWVQLDCGLTINKLVIHSSLTKKKLFPRILIIPRMIF